MSLTISKSFTATGSGGAFAIKSGDSFSYSVSGTFVGTVVLESSADASSFSPVVSKTAAASDSVKSFSPVGAATYYRFRCSAYTSGTIVTSMIEVPAVETVMYIAAAGAAKAGTTSGFVVAVADNIALVTCPASKTASTCIIPISRGKVGDIIQGFYLIGQIESAGGTVTVDADLRVMTAAAADVSDASVGAITQLSVTAQTVMSRSNTAKLDLSQAIAVDQSYYLKITATTGSACDIALQGIGLITKVV